MVGDLARIQTTDDNISRVGMLAWFDVQSQNRVQGVEINSVDVANTLRINKSQYLKAKSVLQEYDLIHTHRPHSGFYAKVIAKRLGKPIVQTEHNNHIAYSTKGQIANAVTNVIADEVVCVSESVHDSFPRWEKALVGDSKVSIIPNGVDIEQLNASREIEWSIHDVVDIDPNAVVVGSAGMLIEQKAHDVLIEAVDRANAETDQPIELVISGDGELYEQLEAQIEMADYSDRLHMLGFLEKREQVHKMMHEIDIYAMPSRWEGFCVAALEAMAIGNACVFSDIDEFVEPFGDQAQFHKTDVPESLKDRLLALARDQEERIKYSERASALVEDQYSLRQTANQYSKLYSQIIQDN
jgi:glycosyltransferase involved in cell wall biosynthesis